MEHVLNVEDVFKRYKSQGDYAVKNVSFSLLEGEIVGILGPNGAGKSTLIKMILGVICPTKGQILVFGNNPLRFEKKDKVKLGVFLGGKSNLIYHLPVLDSVRLFQSIYRVPKAVFAENLARYSQALQCDGFLQQRVATLSLGQRLRAELLCILIYEPQVLILDEPTSQLDPIAASDFLATLGKINRELGTTVLLTEHRLEEAFPLASAVMVMDRGRRLCTGTPAEVGGQLKRSGHGMFLAMPTPMRVWAAVKTGEPCPVTVREGRDFLTAFAENNPLRPLPPQPIPACVEQMALEVHDAWFRYEKDSPDVVKGLQLAVRRGEFLAILGGNGTGKTTTLRLLSGLKKPYRGSVTRNGALAALPQNPQALFVKKTVGEDLQEVFQGTKVSPEERQARIRRVICLCRLEELWNRHPYDLSGGEQQRAALAKVLLLQPEILLLDEPTKGLDAEFKRCFAGILGDLLGQGVAIVMVSHDVEFCAQYADRVGLFFEGNVVTNKPAKEFFAGNSFYTTAANRMSRQFFPDAVTVEDVVAGVDAYVRR